MRTTVVLCGLMLWGYPAWSTILQTIHIPSEQYAAYKVPDPGDDLQLDLVADDGVEIMTSEVQMEDAEDSVLWQRTLATSTKHTYRIGLVLSSREWVWIKGKYRKAGVGDGSGGLPPEFNAVVPGVDLDVEGVDEDVEESGGAMLCVSNGMKTVTIYKVQPVSRFPLASVKFEGGGGKVKVWANADKTGLVTLPKTYAASALPKTLWLEGISPSASIRDTELKASCTCPNGEVTEDKVKLTVIKVDIKAEDGMSDPRENVDADTAIDASYNTVKYKAVVTPNISGTFTWSTSSTKINLVNANNQTVTVNAGANASANVDAEILKVVFTPAGSTTTCDDTHDLTVVHCTFTAYADNVGAIGHGWWRFGVEPADATTLIYPIDIRIWANTDAGYFPATVGDPSGPGQLRMGDQGHTPTSQHAWDIPFILLDNGLTFCRALAASPGNYHLLNNNCCHKVIAASCSCGVNIPGDKDTPEKLHDYLSGL